MAGTLSIVMMLSTPTLAQANAAPDKSLVPLIGQSEIAGLKPKELDLDIGLTDDERRIRLKEEGQAKRQANLQARANKLALDITGLTNDQARIKIKAAERANTLTQLLADAKTLGISINDSLGF